MKTVTRLILGFAIILLSSNPSSAKQFQFEHFILKSNGPVDTAQIKRAIKNTRLKLIELVRDSLSYYPTIHITYSMEEFDSLIGGYFPDWGAAAAIPARKQMVFKSPSSFNLNRDFTEMLAHEYTHLVMAERVAYRSLPRWLNEGLAMSVSSEWNWSDNLAMSQAAVFGQYVPLLEIEQVNSFSESKAHLAYSESYLTVKYLFDAYGVNAVNLLLDRLEAGDSIDLALREATGSKLMEFQSEVWATFEPQFNLLSLFMDTIYFWIALAIILIVGGTMNFRRRKKIYKQWDDDEKLHSTDFDYGDPDNPEQIDDEDEPWRS